MEHKKIANLLGKTIPEVPSFTTKKWIEIFDQSNGSYNPNEGIRFKISQLWSDLCGFNDAYTAVTGEITAANPGNDNNVYNRKSSFKKFSTIFQLHFKN